jgi:hypothetical protein
MTVAFQAYQNIYVQVQEGAYDAELADGWWQLLRNDLEYPGAMAMWEQRKFINSSEFQDFVENQVMKPEPQLSQTGAR